MQNLTIRPATIDDARVLWVWRNDILTRQNSRTTDELPWENHVGWLKKTLESGAPRRNLYVAESEGMPVGTIRTDLHEDGTEEVSWTVAPEARGHGVGKAMLVQFVREKLQGKKIVAGIKNGNIASQKIAEAIGLSLSGEVEKESDPADPVFIWHQK